MRKLILKGLGALLAIALLATAVFVVNLIWFRPFSLNLFYEKVFVTFVLEQPELLSSLGIRAAREPRNRRSGSASMPRR